MVRCFDDHRNSGGRDDDGWSAQADEAAPTSVQIDAGGQGGNGFLPDSYVTNGASATNRSGSKGLANWIRGVSHPIPQEQWDTYRFLESAYRVSGLTPGARYDVRLYFVEWYWTQVGQRVFDVEINGATVLKNFDVMRAAVDTGGDGRYLGIEKEFTATADATGLLSLDFIRGASDQPMISAIVVALAA